jgi:hypothetical protein
MPLTGAGTLLQVTPAPVRDAAVTSAAASPDLASASVTVNGWPVLTVVAEGVTAVATTLAGTWTVVAGAVVAVPEIGVAVAAPVPLALAVNVSVPDPETVQPKA